MVTGLRQDLPVIILSFLNIKFKGDNATGDNVGGSTAAIKLEPTFLTPQEEALPSGAHLNQMRRSWLHNRGSRGFLNVKGE